jgi:hypothetical protein
VQNGESLLLSDHRETIAPTDNQDFPVGEFWLLPVVAFLIYIDALHGMFSM